MLNLNNVAAMHFTESELVTLLLVGLALVIVVALNVMLIYYFRKSGDRKLCTAQLEVKREELLKKLDDMRAGLIPEEEQAVEASAEPAAEEAEEELVDDEAEDDDDEDEEVPAAALEALPEGEEQREAAYEILAVRNMSSATRSRLGFEGSEYNRKQYYVRYTLGFEAKLNEASEEVQARYREFADEVALYKGVKIKNSFKQQRITKGRKTLGLIMFRGKTLCVAFALNPADYAETKYRGIDKSDKKRFEKTPMLFKLTSDRRLEYSKFLLVQIADANTIVMNEQPVKGEYDFTKKTRDELFVEDKLHIQILGEAPDLEGDFEPEEVVEEIAEEVVEPVAEPVEEVAEEVAAEPEIIELEEEEPEEEEEEEAEELVLTDLTDDDENTEVVEEVVINGQVIRYNRSFTARITQSSDVVKERYSQIKNCLLSYKGVKCRTSWKRESFRLGRNTFACFVVRGKTLCINFATDPKRFDGTKYKVIDLSVRSPKSKQPCMLRVTSDRRCRYAKEIIAMLMAEFGVQSLENYAEENFAPEYRTTKALVDDGLIKIVGDGVPVFEDEQVVQPAAEEPAEEAVEEVVEEQPAEEIVQPLEEVEETEADEEEDAEEAEELVLSDLTDDDENTEVVEEVVINGRLIRYNRSFTARITQASDAVKSRYSELKNYILSYKRVTNRTSWKRESFRLGRNTFACFVVRGKTLCLCLATDPKRFDGTKYKVIDLSVRSPKSKQPCMYRISSDRKCRYAKEIIAMLMAEAGAALTEREYENYVLPYRTTEQLIQDDLIRVTGEVEGTFQGFEKPAETEEVAEQPIEEEAVEQPAEEEPAEEILEEQPFETLPERDFEILEEVAVSDADVMSDEEAEQLVEDKVIKKVKINGKKKGIVNIHSLSEHFEAGAHITLESLRERKLIAGDVTFVKVLAKGSLNKPLIVEADDFSLQAVKMIVLTGGRAIRKKYK